MLHFNPPGNGKPPFTRNGGAGDGPDPKRQQVARQVAGVLADLAEVELKAADTYKDWARQMERHGLVAAAGSLWEMAGQNGGRATRLAEMGRKIMEDAGLWRE